MPWYFPWSDSIKKRACRYLLQHYLGHFLKEKLSLDQLSVDLYNGTGTIQDVLLDVWALNEALDSVSVPVEIVDGFIGQISVSIPWSALISDNTIMEIRNLELTIQPKQRAETAGVMLDSMFSSMTTSLQLAQECLRTGQSQGEQVAESAQPFEGLEMFAQTIEAVLTRVKVTFVDTIIRLEHLPKEAKTGAALEIRVDRIEYFDEQAMDTGSPVDQPASTAAPPGGQGVYEPAAIAVKNFHFMGVSMFCDEFPESHRTFTRPDSGRSPTSSKGDLDAGFSPPLSPKSSIYQSTIETQPRSQPLGDPGSPTSRESSPIKIAALSGRQEIRVKVKQSDEVAGPRLELDCHLAAINIHLSPRQVHLLLEIAQGLASPGLCDDSNVRRKAAASKPMEQRDYEKVEHELQQQLLHDRIEQRAERMKPPAAEQQHWVDIDDTLTPQPLDDLEEDEVYFSMAPSESGMTSMHSSMSSSVTSRSTSTTSRAPPSLPKGSVFNYGVGYTKRESGSPFQTTPPKSGRAKYKQAKAKDSLHKLLDDPSAEVTKYKLKFSFLSIIVLHEDPPATSSDGIDPGITSWDKIKKLSSDFFSRAVGIFTAGGSDLVQIREKFTEACPLDHLGLLAKPVTVEVNQKTSAAVYSLHADVTVGLAELVECVFDRRGGTSSILGFSLPIDNILPDYCELLTFIPNETPEPKQTMFSSMHAGATPNIRLKLQSTERHQTRRGSSSAPKMEVHMELGRCRSELDITIIDRIQALLNPAPLASTAASSTYRSTYPTHVQSRQSYFSQAIDEGPGSSEWRQDLRLSTPFAQVFVRFPVPDLRSGQGVDRAPWWRRNLRDDVLILELSDADFLTIFGSGEPCTKYEFTCRDIHGLFQEARDKPPVSFIRISTDDHGTHEKDDGFGWPRLVVKVFPELQSVLEAEVVQEEDLTPQDSLNGACDFQKPQPSPFSSRKVMYENEEMKILMEGLHVHDHDESDQENRGRPFEVLVMPGDRQEMNEFQEKAVNKTRMLIDLNLPTIHALLPSKEFFEVIYNRVNNDLLLWEPLAPAPLDTGEPYSLPGWGVNLAQQYLVQDQQLGCVDRFMMCKSGVQYDSSSDSESESGQYSIYDQKVRQRLRRLQEQGHRQSQLCVNLTINRGKLTACAPLKDEDSAVVADRHGQFVLEIEDGNVFSVIKYHGDPDLRYVCITSHRATLYHGGNVPIPESWPVLQRAALGQVSHLTPTIYLSEPGVTTKLSGQVGRGGDSQDMLSVAIRIKLDTFQSIKEFQVAIGVRGGTLQHRIYPTGQNWFSQMVDFFDVKDYPILGYTMPSVVTELHTHLWSCAVDYRPRFLPMRSMLTVEMFSISSNIIAESSTSLLRFIMEDAALYMSDKCDAKVVDLKRNYVCVMDLGLFELSLRTSDGKDQKYPKLDLRASNNILHIRTCADSCRALADLIVYFANDEDLAGGNDDECGQDSDFKQSLSKQRSETSLASDSPQMSQSHMEQVHDMMADAMRESTSSAPSDDESSGEYHPAPDAEEEGLEVFYFPDESQSKTGPSQPSPAPSPSTLRKPPDQDQPGVTTVTVDMESSATSSMMSSSTERFSDDEEFCIIDDPGMGIAPRNGKPRIRCLTSDPIVIVDKHFQVPLGKTDQLKAPEHFPAAVYRYTLREMSLVWYMYGGYDFESSPKSDLAAVSPKPNTRRKSAKSERMGRVGWQARGGPGRDVDILMELQLNKVRLQHEVFPEGATQVSRQILLINEAEIRDRLASSKINKFLYQYTSDTMPKQATANMLVVKALHVRPDAALMSQQECSLRVSLLPLRLNIDQDALFFLRTFFMSISGTDTSRASTPVRPEPASPAKEPAPPPVMMVGGASETPPQDPQELLIMFDEIEEEEKALNEETEETEEEEDRPKQQPVFFKNFIFSPDVPIRLDYHGKRVDMEQGTLAGLLVGLAQLNCSELRLKRLHHRHGLLGFDRLVLFALTEWLKDIRTHQLPSILGGVGPMYSLVQLVQGIRDLFWLPVEQYRRDGRIVRGLQRGAHSFTTSTAMAALELTNRVVQTVQYAAEVAFDMVSPGPSVRHRKHYKRKRRAAQPADLREGVTNAYIVVKEGIKGTAETIVRVAVEEHELKGVTGAVGGVLRQLPPTVLQPVILATEATSNVLGGMRNQLRPDKKREDEDKWKPDD